MPVNSYIAIKNNLKIVHIYIIRFETAHIKGYFFNNILNICLIFSKEKGRAEVLSVMR